MVTQLEKKGYQIIEHLYSNDEVNKILDLLKSKGIEQKFGIREFLYKHSDLAKNIFTNDLIQLVKKIAPNCNKAIKSIYFDKPPNANWIVNWHQDLTINLKNKIESPGFKNWRIGKERIVVQPDIKILKGIFTIRIHLDDCSKENGALQVVEGSHQSGVINIIEWMIYRKGNIKTCV